MYEEEIKEFVANLSKEKIVRDIQDEFEWWKNGDYGKDINDVLSSIDIEEYIVENEKEMKDGTEKYIQKILNKLIYYIRYDDITLSHNAIEQLISDIYDFLIQQTILEIINTETIKKLNIAFTDIYKYYLDFLNETLEKLRRD